MLNGRRVLLAVTGGVAAYKSAYLARRLVEAGVEIRVILTESALEFIGPQTFAAITGTQPYTNLFGEKRSVSPHTELARWAHLMVVAPATANTLGRIATGISSDLVSSTVLAAQCPILLAPAMHTEMWENPAVGRNIKILRGDGYQFVGPVLGPLAGGDTGMGRMSEPDEIVAAVETILTPQANPLRLLVTAGGTKEPIDPVRYLGNRSSGKMGHAVATEGAARGMAVTLVTSSNLPVAAGVQVIEIETAQEMADAVADIETDVAVMAAAVADFRPTMMSASKLSRSEGLDAIPLEPTPDVLASVVARDMKPFVVGFAAETGDLERAIGKARDKRVDLLVYNDVSEAGSGFGTNTNRVVVIDSTGETDPWPLMTKDEVASGILDLIVSQMGAQE